MSASALFVQFLNGLASASSLFLVAAGLSLIFGVTRIVNFAHGSLYMLGAYCAVSLAGQFTELELARPLGFWGAVLLSGLAVALLGVLLEVSHPRRNLRGFTRQVVLCAALVEPRCYLADDGMLFGD